MGLCVPSIVNPKLNMDEKLFQLVSEEVNRFYEKLPTEPVGVLFPQEVLQSSICSKLPEQGESDETALKTLINGVEKALLHSVHPRFFGYVIGGAMPVSIAADWLTSAWDQCGHVYHTSPASAIVEEVVRTWILDLLDLPPTCGMGFVTGAQMANYVGLSVARNAMLEAWGWDVDSKGLQNAPWLSIICGECCHGTVKSAVRMIGLGTDNIVSVPADDQGRMQVSELKHLLRCQKDPAILCLQAGNVNTGAFDRFEEIIELAHAQNIWVHVDGAFGLWARATPALKPLTHGLELADSWSVDAHKWLNVPYDSGMIIIREAEQHRRLKTTRCAYAGEISDHHRDGTEWVPENSRRARAFVLYATLRALGREGVEQLIDRGCDMAKRFASELSKLPEVSVMHEVVLNQVVSRIEAPTIVDADAFHTTVATRLQQLGVCWIGTTVWRNVTALRISVSNYLTREQDVDTTVECVKTIVQDALKEHTTD